MSDSTAVKSLRIPVFDGKVQNYQVWVTRFRAYAGVFGFAAALIEGGEINLPTTEETEVDETSDTDAPIRAAKKRNAVAMANLTMAFTTDEAMSLVYDAASTDWPAGLAWKIMLAMKKKYQPDDTISRVELRRQLNSVAMKRNEDPATLFEQLSGIKNRYNTTSTRISTEELLAVIIDSAHEDYQSVLTSEQRRLGTAITMGDLQSAMNQQWRATHGGAHNKNDGVEEMNLSAFNGECYKCGKQGHRANDCKSKGKGRGKMNGKSGQKFKGECFHCGKKGHRETDCWQKDKNSKKRPDGYNKPGQESGLASGDGLEYEYLLCGVEQQWVEVDHEDSCNGSVGEELLGDMHEFVLGSIAFATDQRMLNDPNVWIADTGASTHSTPHGIGMSNCKGGSVKDSIMIGDGSSVRASKVG